MLPPDVEGWEQSAVEWLLDHGDPAWRTDPLLRVQPVVLARFTRGRAHAHVAAARQLWAHGPRLLAGVEPEPGVLAAVRALLEREGPALAARAAEVDLVADALAGQRWVPRL